VTAGLRAHVIEKNRRLAVDFSDAAHAG
jgi:hypothetical protein